jgi:regulator of protease activity HflC (stomatin/prohibitin superfamily)
MPATAMIVVAAFILLVVLGVIRPRSVIVYEYQQALQYSRGRYTRTLGPGSYWIASRVSTVVPVDIRAEFITVPGQDVLSADGVTLKVSLAAEFQVVDANLAVNKTANYRGSLYLRLQMALREIIGKEKIDALLENRSGIGAKLMEMASGKASELGLKLLSADMKDIMLSGDMKKAFAQVIKAQKEGQAALERARGESAALRNLANAARAIDDNPNLLQLRALQALADSSGNTLVLGIPDGAVPFTRQSRKDRPASSKEGEQEQP